MKQDFAFAAERAVARHDPALLRPGPADADLLEALAAAGARLARALRGALARLCGGEPPEITIAPPHEAGLAEFARDGLAAYTLYTAAPSGDRVLGAIDGESVLRLVDRAFGGQGEAPYPLPRELPLSADLMVQRIEAIVATDLGHALGGATGPRPTIHPLRRDGDLAQLQPFAPATRLAVLDIAVAQPARAAWSIHLAFPLAALPVLTGIAPPPGPDAGRATPADPGDEPFAAMPLPLCAVLIDTHLPLQVISRLEPGQVLNLPMARLVPLMIGQRTIAHGTIGAIDDRVAIQITHPA
jgi:flagellar motor switch protein FliM